MRKTDLIQTIATKTGITKVDVLVTLEAAFKEIKSTLATGEHIYIRGFGSFVTKRRAAKKGRDIKRKVPVSIPAHFIPAFRPAREFIEVTKKLSMNERPTAS